MTSSRKQERGEGKIGCFTSLVVLLILTAVALKVVPVLWTNNNLVNAAEDLGSRAGVLSAPALDQQLRAKAAELEIPEALIKGAMVINVMGDKQSGTCVIKLHFIRKVDLYGVYTVPIPMDKDIARPYMDAR